MCLESIARPATVNDIKGFQGVGIRKQLFLTPFAQGGVLNAAAYRSFLLTSASQVLSEESLRRKWRWNLILF